MKNRYLSSVIICVTALIGTRADAQTSPSATPSNVSQTAIEASRTKATQAELASIAKAQEVRDAVMTTPPTDAITGERLRSELRKLVLDAFLARHELQVMEVNLLLQKAQQMQTKLDGRQSNHASIIDRRVEDLLSPDLNWNAELASAKSPSATSPLVRQRFDTPQELLAFMIKCSDKRDYESYVSLLTDDAARDLAGMLLLSANSLMAQVDSDTKEYGAEAMSELMTSPVKAVPEALAHWSKPELTVQQKRVLENSRSTAPVMALSGTGPNANDITVSLRSIRILAETITDHRQFSVEMMEALSRVAGADLFFGNSGQTLTSTVEQTGNQATATIACWDKTPATVSSGQSYTPTSVTKIGLQRIDGHWLISNLLDESHAGMFDSSEQVPADIRSGNPVPFPTAEVAIISKSYRVANMVTEPLFSSDALCEQKQEFAKHEVAIEKEMQSLAETIRSACSQPPKYVQTVVPSRSLLIGHTEAGHREIEHLFFQLKVSTSERIRLQFAIISPESFAAEGMDFDIENGNGPTTDQIQKIWDKVAEAPETKTSHLYPQHTIWPGEKVSLSRGMISVTARIVPGTRIVQIRMLQVGTDEDDPDPHCYPTIKKIKDGQIANFFLSFNNSFLVKAEILKEELSQDSTAADRSADSESPNTDPAQDATTSTSLAYQGKPVTYWLDAYWTAATANEKTQGTNAPWLAAKMAIAEFRERPECDAAILQAMAKWSASVENELSPNRLRDVAECVTYAGGKRHQLQALEHLFKIADRMPAQATVDSYSMNFLTTVTVTDGQGEFTLKQEFKKLSFDDELSTLLTKMISSGTSKQRLFAYVLLMAVGRDNGTRNDPTKAAREAWQNEELLVLEPSFLDASEDESEEVRSLSALFLAHPLYKNPLVRERLIAMIESDPSSTVRSMAISSIADVASAADSAEANTLSGEVISCLTKAVRNDSSNDVKSAALNALTQRRLENELVHQTLMEWSRSEDPKIVMLALDSHYNGSTNGKHPQSVAELIELLNDPAWGTKVEVNRNNFSKHHRWARQYAIAVLGQYDSRALPALPILEAELANKETATFAREAIDRISGYCSDLPVKSLQGKWRLALGVSPAGQAEMSPLLPLKADADEAAPIFEIAGTQLLKVGKCIGQISHARGSSQQVVQIVLDGEAEPRRLTGSINPEDDGTVRDQYQLRLGKVFYIEGEKTRTDVYELRKVETDKLRVEKQ